MENLFTQTPYTESAFEESDEGVKGAIEYKKSQFRIEIRQKKNKDEVSEKRRALISTCEEEKEKERETQLENLSIENKEELLKQQINSLVNNGSYEESEEHLKTILCLLKFDHLTLDDSYLARFASVLVDTFNKFNTCESLMIIDLLYEKLSSATSQFILKALFKLDLVIIASNKIPTAHQKLLNNILYTLFIATEVQGNLVNQVIKCQVVEEMLKRFYQNRNELNDIGWVYLFALYSNLAHHAPFPEYIPYFVSNLKTVIGFLCVSLKDQDQELMLKYHLLKSLAHLGKKETRFAQHFCEQEQYLNKIRSAYINLGPYALIMGQLLDILTIIASLDNNDNAVAYLVFEKDFEESTKSNSLIESGSSQNNNDSKEKENNKQTQIYKHKGSNIIEFLLLLAQGKHQQEQVTIQVYQLLNNILLSGDICFRECVKFQVGQKLAQILKGKMKEKSYLECLSTLNTYLALFFNKGEFSALVKFALETKISYNFLDTTTMKDEQTMLQLQILKMLLLAGQSSLEIIEENSGENENVMLIQLIKCRQMQLIQNLQYHNNKNIYSLAQSIIEEFVDTNTS